jgi:hypothetical protein
MKKSLVLFGCLFTCLLKFAPIYTQDKINPTKKEITATAFGDIYDTSDGGHPMGKGGNFHTLPSGDSWYTAWGADDSLFINVDDGLGFEDPGGKHIMLRHALCKMNGNPNESTDGFKGVNLNPGILGNTIPNSVNTGDHGYTTGMYEVDGVIYQARHAWNPMPNLWPPIYNSITKSPDGGRNWYDHLGQKNVPLTTGSNSMFPVLPWSWINFIQYGKSGAAPAIDNADKYIYINSDTFLARVPRAKIADLNKADYQYFKGSPLDGMLDSSWSNLPSDARKVSFPFEDPGMVNIVYNFSLKKYVASSVYWCKATSAPEFSDKTRFEINVADHPWGPWRQTMSYGIWGRAGWNMLMANKFTSFNGLKMWYLFCGEYKGDVWYYGLQYMPLYLSTGVVDKYEEAKLTGVKVGSTYPEFSGSNYIENFTKVGDSAVFEINNVNGTGWHIVRIRYTSPKKNRNTMSIFINGKKTKRIIFSENNNDYKPGFNWVDRSDVYYLKNGSNIIEIRQDQGDSGINLMIDYLAVSRELTFDEGLNIAPEATVTTSSGNGANAINGCAFDESSEWSGATNNGEWIQLDWKGKRNISKVRLYDRVNTRDQVLSGTLTFSDGSNVAIGRLQNDGQYGSFVTFPTKNITWVKFTIDKVRNGTVNAGLGEIEAYTNDSK